MIEVARFRMPMAVRGMDDLADYLEHAYGKGLMMRVEGEWMLVEKPEES